MQGYQEDSLQSGPDLTEMLLDTVQWKYIDIDTLGQLYEKDTASVKVIYHNDRTFEQGQSIMKYLISKGAQPDNLEIITNVVPAVLPEEKKLSIKVKVVSM